jgi:hypothetical protein
MRRLSIQKHKILCTPAGTSTPAILTDVRPTMQGSGLITSNDKQLMTAVYKMEDQLWHLDHIKFK